MAQGCTGYCMKKFDEISAEVIDIQLLDAVIADDIQLVEELLAQGANPNYFEDKCEIRPLHFASVYNATEVIFPLVRSGAKIDAVTADGYTATDIARQLNHTEVVTILTQLSANLVSFYED